MQPNPPPQQGPPWTGPPQGPPQGPPWTWPGWARRGMRWRISATILIGTAWLVFILLYAAFWSRPFDLFQNIVIFFASIVVALGLLAAVWASWGMRFAGGGNWDHWH